MRWDFEKSSQNLFLNFAQKSQILRFIYPKLDFLYPVSRPAQYSSTKLVDETKLGRLNFEVSAWPFHVVSYVDV